MWLFDNIFLDKDTPTALLDNPEIKPPDGTPKKVEAAAPYDPKNDPIAPAVDAWAEKASAETNPADVSFDIWGDLDFSGIEAAPAWASWITGVSEVSTSAPATSTLEGATNTTDIGWVSSIAMIQWWTASMVDGIDIWGISGIDIWGVSGIEAPKVTIESTSPEWATETPSLPETSVTGLGDIQIHAVEDHAEGSTENLDGSHGIFGLMWNEESTSASLLPEITESAPLTAEWIKEEAVTIQESAESQQIEPIMELQDDKPLDLIMDFWASESHSERGGRIQELISKLISELQKLDEEEVRADKERQKKIVSITEREAALEHEYTTRKEALKYERSALELPEDKTAEKSRIKSLIASFEEDLG